MRTEKNLHTTPLERNPNRLTRVKPDQERKRAPGAGRKRHLPPTVRLEFGCPEELIPLLDEIRGDRSRGDVCREALEQFIRAAVADRLRDGPGTQEVPTPLAAHRETCHVCDPDSLCPVGSRLRAEEVGR